MTTTASTLAARTRETEALTMRTEGATWATISQRLHFGGASNAHRAAHRALSRVPAEAAEQMRRVESERLDALWRAVWPEAVRGDVAAVRAAVRVSERRCRLFGLDAAQSVAVRVQSETDAEIEKLVQEILALGDGGSGHAVVTDHAENAGTARDGDSDVPGVTRR